MRYRDECADLMSRVIDLQASGGDLSGLFDVVDEADGDVWNENRLRMLTREWFSTCDFAVLRVLELRGLRTFVHDDGYVLAMVGALGHRNIMGIREFFLTHDTELREIWWRVFEVEGGGQVSLTNVDMYTAPAASWQATVLTLVETGVLPRERLLRSCLQALNRDFSSYRAGWFSRMFTALEPSVAELAANQSLLNSLLASNVSSTVSFAVKNLALLHKKHALDYEPFIRACPAALGSAAKSSAIAILKILSAARAAADENEGPVDAVAAALHSRHPEVQQLAVSLLTKWAAVQKVHDNWDGLAASVQDKIRQLAPTSADPIPSSFVPFDVPVSGTVVPWKSDEIVERTAVLLEGDSDPVEFELALRAWSSLPDPSILSPLAKRASKINEDAPDRQRGVAAAVLTAVGRRPPRPFDAPPQQWFEWPAGWRPHTGGHKPMGDRQLQEVIGVLAGDRPPLELLSTPTQTNGWLDPGEFANRLSQLRSAPLHHDLVAALLRLAPDGREAAMKVAARTRGEPGAVSSYALGGPPDRIRTAAWWVAAGYSRSPFEDDAHLDQAGLKLRGQAEPPQIRLRTCLPPGSDYLALNVDGAGDRAWIVDQPTVIPDLAIRQANRKGPIASLSDSYPAALRTQALLIPADADLFAVTALSTVVFDLDYFNSRNASAAALTGLLHHPGQFGPISAALIAFALSSVNSSHRSQAAETFAAVIPGKLSSQTVAAAMAQFRGLCIPRRWATSLTDAAQLNPVAVLDTLVALIPELPPTDRTHTVLLPVLLEETLRLGRTIPNPILRAHLGTFSGSGKTAAVAKRLAQLY